MKLKINRDNLHKLYMQKINEICEICDWKTEFGPEEIINIISNIIEGNPDKIIEFSASLEEYSEFKNKKTFTIPNIDKLFPSRPFAPMPIEPMPIEPMPEFKSTCPKCKMEFKGLTGYVCNRHDCPSGLGPILC